ncbi:hypothetical protein DL770_000135 [Monosporascus sp. CRB-9-2]|nr:hypothetical protein DL770_000135 [Monosporascus sp. CRB-9-2]
MDPTSDSVSRSTTSATSGSTRSFLGRSLIRRESKTVTKDEQEGPKGPMGLTTLYEPDGQVVVDLIFVHGLNGGSQSTWSKGTGASFWPQDWLPNDDAFRDVRIHTFGYSSGINRESILNIHDFANNLLACVHHSPAMASKGTPMYYGVGKGLIVEKHCAVMNYPNERRTYLDANHRDVARFSAPSEPSYVLIRNALAMTVESQRSSLDSDRQEVEHDGLVALSRFLGISSAPEDDLMTNDSQKLPGSCQWLIQRDTFQQWRDAMTSKVLWLRGPWQMAALHPEAFAELSYLSNNWKDTPIDKVDHNPVWRRIFSTGLLKIRLRRPQYWVIDALDECKNGSELMKFLRKAQDMWPLCVLVTSRAGVETYITSSNPSMEVICETILEDNKSDIAAFLTANLQNLPGATTGAQQRMADQILHNSSGCFLWVNLVLKELRQVHTSAEISQVLGSNPSDMDSLYSRILDEMSHAKFGKDLAKAILTWTTCAFRPLSTEEIHYAIEKDIKDSIDDIGKSISSCCSNLVYIDKAGKVQLVHLTAREFLTRKELDSEYRIDRASGHKRLALVCLRVLSGGQSGPRRPSKARRPGTDVTTENNSALRDYASTYLFQHLLQVRSSDNEIFIELAKFLSSHEVLSWIERLSRNSDLQRLYQAGKNCTNMVTRRMQHTPPIGIQKELTLVERWGTDLVRLVNKFGKQLNQFPSSIHHLIPPFCPAESALRKQFVNPYRGLNIQGCVHTDWDDCLSTISYSRLSKPMNIASSEDCTALALSNGDIIVYDNTTLLERHAFKHGEPVWSIAFGNTGKRLATGGAKAVRVWDLDSSEQLLTFKVPAVCMALAFMEEDDLLVAVTKNNCITYWDVVHDNPRDDPIDWTRDFGESDPQLHLKRPTIAAFSVEQSLLAIIYRGEDILLWSLDEDQVYDLYTKDSGSRRFELQKVADGSTTAWAVAFSTTIEANLLVAAYSDGDVIVFDTESGTRRGSIDGINAQTISCSPDGRTLATADSHGIIHLFDLKTLKFIYCLRFDTDALRTKMLAFTSDNLRLLDIRGHQFRHDTLWSLAPENTEEHIARTNGNTKPRWAVSPLNDDVLVRFEATTASFFSWKTLERIRSVDLASAQNNIDSVIPLQHPQYLVTARRERPHERGSPTAYHLWDFRDFMFQPLLTNTLRSEPVTVKPVLDFGALGLKVESVIGVANERIIFLTPDNWVCSAEIGLSEADLNPTTGSSRTTEGVVHHFFIPDEWSSLVHRVLVDMITRLSSYATPSPSV